MPKKRVMMGAMHHARPGRNSRRKPMRGRGCGFAESQPCRVRMEVTLCEEMRGRGGLAEAGERRVPQGQLAESGLDRKKSVMILAVKGESEQRQVKGE